jgi:HK97 family phage major capsid protein
MTDYVADARRDKFLSGFDTAEAMVDSLNPPGVIDVRTGGYPTRGALRGRNLEITQELQRIRPTRSANGFYIPWQRVDRAVRETMRATRALTVGVGSAGGYMVEGEVHPAVSALYNTTTVVPSGAQVFADNVANFIAPTQSGTATAVWLDTENAQIDASGTGQTFSQAVGTPHGVGADTQISRQALLQAAGIADTVTYDLMKLVAVAIDLAALAGTGVSGQPVGLLNLGGITTFSGTSFSLATAMGAATDIGNALDYSSAWIANRTAASTLRQRQEVTNSTRMLWEDDLLVGEITGFPARSTQSLASGVMVFGAWRHLKLPIWGPGLEVEINPYSGFQAGIVGVRCLCYVDVVVDYQGAFAATSTFS